MVEQHILEKLQEFQRQAKDIILDKEQEIQLVLACILADGHLLLEDIPGVGKTTLVKTVARLLGLQFSRIQFTNDMLPADILGSSIYSRDKNRFEFHRGPIFAQLVLADELNRATPKTQSACLQAMEERQVSIDGNTYTLPRPFFLVATQNPRQQIGTFPIPESQLDRFLVRLQLGFPSREAERRLLEGESRLLLLERLTPVMSPDDLPPLQEAVRQVHTSPALLNYLQDLVEQSRHRDRSQGLSPRGAQGLLSMAKAWAFLQKREMVLPEDVQTVAVPVMAHRLNPVDDASGDTGIRIVEEILANTRVE